MFTILGIIALVVLIFFAFCLLAYILGKMRLFFVIVTEGAAVPIERSGGGFDHFIMKWQGYTLNDPRQPWYTKSFPDWEVMLWNPQIADNPPSIYRLPLYWLAPLWRLLERFGIYWYGFYPFKQVGDYTFEWTEKRVDETTAEEKPWYRREPTWFIYLKSFAYWIKLTAAEDKDNIPVDLDYLLTVEINNPYKALYVISNWLNRTSADANNEAKIFVGGSTFEELGKERRASDNENVNKFSNAMLRLNSNVYTETGEHGTRESYGVTIKAVSLNEVTLAGLDKVEIARATTAKTVAERTAEATVATAEGAAKAAVVVAEGNAKAVRLAADAEKYAVDIVYGEIQKHGPEGIAIRQLQAIEKAGAGGNQVIWANNPLMEAARIFRPTPNGNPTPPPAPQPPHKP